MDHPRAWSRPVLRSPRLTKETPGRVGPRRLPVSRPLLSNEHNPLESDPSGSHPERGTVRCSGGLARSPKLPVGQPARHVGLPTKRSPQRAQRSGPATPLSAHASAERHGPRASSPVRDLRPRPPVATLGSHSHRTRRVGGPPGDQPGGAHALTPPFGISFERPRARQPRAFSGDFFLRGARSEGRSARLRPGGVVLSGPAYSMCSADFPAKREC